jgi:hypothetical protein
MLRLAVLLEALSGMEDARLNYAEQVGTPQQPAGSRAAELYWRGGGVHKRSGYIFATSRLRLCVCSGNQHSWHRVMLAVLVLCSSTASIGGLAVIADIAAPHCATKQPLSHSDALSVLSGPSVYLLCFLQHAEAIGLDSDQLAAARLAAARSSSITEVSFC